MEGELTRPALKELAGRRIYDRGVRYAEERRVHSLQATGTMIRGQVVGSEIYETWLDLEGSFGYGCSCPYEGLCKHVVALAITWWDGQGAEEEAEAAGHGADLSEVAPLAPHLEAVGAAELRQLVLEMAVTVPGAWPAVVKFLLKRRVAALGLDPANAELEAQVVRDTLRGIVSGELRPPTWVDSDMQVWNDYWDYAEADLPEPEPYRAAEQLVDVLIGSVEAQEAPASFPFRLLALTGCACELAASGLEAYGHKGLSQLNRVVARLGAWLSAPDCPAEAAGAALLQLLETYLCSGQRLAERLKPAMVAVADSPVLRAWFLAVLEEQARHPREPARSRLRGLAGEVCTRAGQLQAALSAFEQADCSANLILDVAQKALETKDWPLVVQAAGLACARAKGWERGGVRRAAADYLRAAGEVQGAEELLLEAFAESPKLETAFTVLKRAVREEDRVRLAEAMLARLAGQSQPALRIHLLLLAKRYREAMGELERMDEFDPQLHATVAVGISRDDLDSAIVLWSRAVEALIGQKQRSAYAEAALMLIQMRRAMIRGGRELWWWKYYGDLQARYAGYKVLREELEAAGLNRDE